MKSLFVLIISVVLALPTSVAAYGGGGGDSTAGLSRATTTKVVRTLTRGVRGCFKLDKEYRYDCYRQTYAQAANQIKANEAYDDARAVLLDVEKALARTINRNVDTSKPLVRRGVQRFRAIKPGAVPRAKRDFITALDKAETKLLRSADNNGAHFVRIAEAINTNKVLLRSALLILPVPTVVKLAFAWPVTESRQGDVNS